MGRKQPSTPYTRFPRWLIACMVSMEPDVVRLVVAVVRSTCSWHTERASLTDKQLEELTGMRLDRIRCAVRLAIKDGYITVKDGMYAVAPHPLWALPYDEYLRTDHWRKMRASAIQNAENRCQVCNKGGQ